METFIESTQKIFTNTEILFYYRNLWKRNVVARAIDVVTDTAKKAVNPEEEVEYIDPITRQVTYMPVKERLELRKVLVKEAQELLTAIDSMLATKEEDFYNTYFSEKALAVAEDMIGPKAGDTCTTEDGRPGAMFETGNGLVCLAKKEETPVVDAEVTPAPQGEDPQPEPENTPDETPAETAGESEESESNQ